MIWTIEQGALRPAFKQKQGVTHITIEWLFVMAISLLWAGSAGAQVTYTPVDALGILITGIRSNSSTMDDVVITSGYRSFSGTNCHQALSGGVYPALYAGSLQDVPTAPLTSWNCLTPNLDNQTVTAGTFYGPNTPLFDPNLGEGNVLAVGSYKYSNNQDPSSDHGIIYQGPVTGCPGGSSSCWTQIDPTCLVTDPERLKNTIAHSTMGDLVVGNFDTNLAVGRAFIYNMPGMKGGAKRTSRPPGNCQFTELKLTGSISVTAYGIWQNSDGSYTIAGGISDLNNNGVDAGYLADYDPTTMTVTQVKTYQYDNKPLDSLISHFDGITATANGYNLTGDYLTADGMLGAFFASVTRNSDGTFGDATWTNIAFAYMGIKDVRVTSGNTVIDNYVLGVFNGIVPGNAQYQFPGVFTTLSYVASVSTQ